MDADGILELFGSVGAVRLRRMFGGHGVYIDGLIIALAFDGEVWLKADAVTRPLFEAAGSRPFTYLRSGGTTTVTSYWLAPEAVFDDPDEMRRWARLAQQAAGRAAVGKSRRSRRRAADDAGNS